MLISLDVYTDCPDINCRSQRLDDKAAAKTTGELYDKLFVRHWDTWADGRRSQLFLGEFGPDGKLLPKLTLMSRGIDGDVPSKLFGDDSEYALLGRRQDCLFRRAHRRQERTVVDEFRSVRRASRCLVAAAQSHGGQSGLGRESAAIVRRQDAATTSRMKRPASRPTALGPHGARSRERQDA